MKFTALFIQRPVLSTIINALIVVLGMLSLQHITFREYPHIEVPILSVEARYPNASAETVESTVTQPLEDALSKVEGLDAMASETRYESVTINLQLKEGSSLDRGMILVRDALSSARNQLPKDVKEPTVKRNADRDSGPPFMAIMVQSTKRSQGDLYHLAQTSLRNVLQSIKGVSNVQIWGNPYTMMVDLDPKKMYALGINVDDITKAFEQNNLSFPAGRFKDAIPVVLDLSVKTPEDFENIIIKPRPHTPILLSHVATVTLKDDTRTFRMRKGDDSATILSLSCASDANALDVSDAVKRELYHLQRTAPDDVTLTLELDQADFIRESLSNVKHSIIEAIVLVMIIIFIFLRNIRASVIPIVTIPIALLGVVTFLYAFGYTLNTTTLLALVLAVGLVVDDAIVVLENIYRHIEEGMTPLMAAKKGSAEIGFAILAMTITLASVFVPIAFLQGFTGKLLVEFAVTLSGAVLISGVTAITLSPMMCARLLKKNDTHYFPKIDGVLETIHKKYEAFLHWIAPHTKWMIGGAVVLILSNIWLATSLPGEMTPKEDRGFIWIYSPFFPGHNLDTQETWMKKIEERVKNVEGVASRLTFVGHWGGTVVLNLEPMSKRKKTAADMALMLQQIYGDFPTVDVYVSSWDNGLQDLSIVGVHGQFGAAIKTIDSYANLEKTMQGFMGKVMASNAYQEAFSSLRLNYPSLKIYVDEYTIAQLAIPPSLVAKTIETFFSGLRHYQFDKDTARYDITLQPQNSPEHLSEMYINLPSLEKNGSSKNRLISLSTLARMENISVPKELTHYNQMRSTIFNMTMREGESISKGMEAFEKLKDQNLPKDLRTEWVGSAKMYLDSSSELIILLVLGLVFIYAVLAIQFESFLDPFIILLTVPLAAFGALFFLFIFGQSMNIFTKVGLLTLIGLITKHGILLVEFANQQREKGFSIQESAMKAAHLRLRPILMTTCAMVIGSIPLVFSTGAGSESRRAIGLTLVGGLSVGTILTLTLIPFAYVMLKGLRERHH